MKLKEALFELNTKNIFMLNENILIVSICKYHLENKILGYEIDDNFSKFTINKFYNNYHINYKYIKTGDVKTFTLTYSEVLKYKRLLK